YSSETQPLLGVRWSGDGKRIAVTETRTFNKSSYRILIIDAETGRAADLTGGDPDARPSVVAWSGENEGIYSKDPPSEFAVQTSQFVAHDVRTGQVRGLFWTRDFSGPLDVPAPGRVVFGAVARRQNLKAITLGGGTGSPEVRTLTFGNSLDRQP